MAVKTRFFGKTASRSHDVRIEVEDETVERMMSAIEGSVSTVGLMQFMKVYASPYFEEQVVRRFANHGGPGVPGGGWAPLEASTIAIRHALGHTDDEAINERTGDLMHYVAFTREYQTMPDMVVMQIPEDTSDPDLERKLKTAQMGAVQRGGDMIPGAYTPPRPVLGLDPVDEAAIHRLLHMHVAYWVATHARLS